MEYELLDFDRNYNDRIVKEDALQWELPMPLWPSYDFTKIEYYGKVIEIRKEGSLLIAVCDEFNEDPDHYDFGFGIYQIKSHQETVNGRETLIVEWGKIQYVVAAPLPAFPMRSVRV